MSIYIVEVPHRMPPSVWVAESESEMINRVANAASRSSAEINTFEDAVDWALHDAHGGAVYMTDAEAIEALDTGAGLPQHQHIKALAALKRALKQNGALPENPNQEDDGD